MTEEKRALKFKKVGYKEPARSRLDPHNTQLSHLVCLCFYPTFLKYLCTDQMKKREGGEGQLGRSNISASDQLSSLIPLSPP